MKLCHSQLFIKKYFLKKENLSSLTKKNSSKINFSILKSLSELKILLDETELLKKTTTTILEDLGTLESILTIIVAKNSEIDASTKLNTNIENMNGDSTVLEEVLEFEKKLNGIEKQISFFLNYGDAFSILKNKFLLYRKNIVENTSLSETLSISGNIYNQILPEFWTLEPKNMSTNLKPSNNNFTVEKINDNFYGSVIGSIEFFRGKHLWDVRIDSLNVSEPGKNCWMLIDVIEKNSFNIKNIYNYSYSYSISTIAQQYQIEGSVAIIQQGDILHLEFDCDAGTFHILGKGIDLKASGLQGKQMVPFVELIDIGCKCTITPIQ